MQTTLTASTEIPTALPDIEADEDREKLVLENQNEAGDDELDAEDFEGEDIPKPQASRAGKILKSIAGFTVFLFLMGVAITWFFGMGWFATPKPQAVNRNGQKDAPSAPMTEDEKLKAALTMVASKTPNTTGDTTGDSSANLPEDVVTAGKPDKISGQSYDIPSVQTSRAGAEPATMSIATTLASQEERKGQRETLNPKLTEVASRANGSEFLQATTSLEPLGRSLFFGISKAKNQVIASPVKEPPIPEPDRAKQKAIGQIPFGTLLPVRLIGAIYTLRNSGGIVRMELTQPIEGKGYSYPAGTILVGNARGGESVRAFVTVVGLIDPVSGEFVRFTGELMGTDGASGINGERRRVTGKWARFFRGLKDTAGSILGSAGSLRSGGTVILSEPLRRSSEKLSEDTSQSLFGNDREDTFLEVLAGTSGYVLVTQLPEATTTTPLTTSTNAGAEKE